MKLSKKHMIVIFAVTGFLGALSLCLVSSGLFGTAADRHIKALADRPANTQPRIEDRWEDIEGFIQFNEDGTLLMVTRGKGVEGTWKPCNSDPLEYLLETEVNGVKKQEKLRVELDGDWLTTRGEKGKKRVLQRMR